MQDKVVILSRTDSIGDVVLTLPMAGLIKQQYPGCKLIFLGRTYTAAIVATSHFVDGFINYDELEKLAFDQRVQRIKEIKADIIVHVFPQPDIARLAKKAKIPLRVGTTNRLFHWYTCNKLVPMSRRRSPLHESQLNLKLVAFMGVPMVSLKQMPGYYGTTKVPALQPEFLALIDPSRCNVILHPKSKGSGMEWGLDNFVALVSLLPAQRYRVFLSGTAADGQQMTDALLNHPGVVNLVNKLSLEQFIAFIAHSDALVAASTGPLHIAAALGKKAIGLFSSRKPIHPGRWMPVGIKARYIVKDENCERCKGKEDCQCIRQITPLQIVTLLES